MTKHVRSLDVRSTLMDAAGALRCKRSRRMTLMVPISGSVYTSLNEGYATHEVTNQAPPLEGYNVFG